MNSNAPKSAKEALEESVLTKSKPNVAEKTSGDTPKESASAEDYDFGFGEGSEGGVEIADESGVMEKEYEITGDIHSNPNHNLFQILSLRYQRSGLRRLFDTQGRTKADAPAENQINQK